MFRLNRRQALGVLGAGAGTLMMPSLLRAQGARPSITIAVQKITNNNTLDPWNEQSNVAERVMYPNLWEGLIQRNWMGDQGPLPCLATEWSRVDDRTLELKLRRGVKFHNGDELTAEDVAFSFSSERLFGDTQPVRGETIYPNFSKRISAKDIPATLPSVGRRMWPGLEGVEIIDRYTVRFRNSTPDVTLENRLYAGGSEIASRRSWDEAATYADWATRPATTGPYRVEKYSPDVSLTLVAFDEYWGGRPPLERITFVEVPEVASRVNGLLTGEYDFACDLPPDQIGIVKNAPGLEIQSSTIWNHRISVFNTGNPWLADAKLRRAMTHSIDRQAIVDALWGGMTKVPSGMQFDSYRAGDMFIDGWSAPAFNPELARDLVRQSGYKGDAIPYRLLNDYYTNQVSTAQVLVEMWRQVGLNVEIQMKENWGQVSDPSTTRGIWDWSASNTINDPITPFVTQFGPNSDPQIEGDWKNEEFNRLSVVLETSADRAERKRAFARMIEICEHEDPAYQVLHQNAVFTGMRADLKWKAAPAFAMDFRASNWFAG